MLQKLLSRYQSVILCHLPPSIPENNAKPEENFPKTVYCTISGKHHIFHRKWMLSLFSQIPSGEHSPPYKGPFSPIRLLLLTIIIHIFHPHSPSIKVTFSLPWSKRLFPSLQACQSVPSVGQCKLSCSSCFKSSQIQSATPDKSLSWEVLLQPHVTSCCSTNAYVKTSLSLWGA